MMEMYLSLSGTLCVGITLLGLVLCCVSGFSSLFDSSPPSREQTAVAGMLLLLLGILGLIFPVLTILYVVLICVALILLACFGVYRTFFDTKESQKNS